MLLIGIIGFGVLVGGAAQLIVGTGRRGVDWGMAIISGLVGSFVGGLLISLIAGDGLHFRPSGIIGSIAGAILVTLLWRWLAGRRAARIKAEAKAQARAQSRPQSRSKARSKSRSKSRSR